MLTNLSSKAAANSLKKNQLYFHKTNVLATACKSFASGPQKNPFDKVKKSLGNSQFYNLPALGDNRLGKSYIFIINLVLQPNFLTRCVSCLKAQYETVTSLTSLVMMLRRFWTGKRTLRKMWIFHSSLQESFFKISRKYHLN